MELLWQEFLRECAQQNAPLLDVLYEAKRRFGAASHFLEKSF